MTVKLHGKEYDAHKTAELIMQILKNSGFDIPSGDHIKHHQSIDRALLGFSDNYNILNHRIDAQQGNLKIVHGMNIEISKAINDLRTRVAVLESKLERMGVPK